MDSSTQTLVDSYIREVSQLIDAVKGWTGEIGAFSWADEIYDVNEERTGPYVAPGLHLMTAEGKRVADLVPRGVFIIAAEGRVDLRGTVDHEVLLWLKADAQRMESTIEVGGSVVVRQSEPLFRGVDVDGWYWIEDRRAQRAYALNKDRFSDLLCRVSDYVPAY